MTAAHSHHGGPSVLAVEEGPWPGPRPFRSEENQLLFGRDDDQRELLVQLLQNRVLVLHAESGVGKTSILRAGVAPTLTNYGRLPVFCNWEHTRPGGAASLYAQVLWKALDSLDISLDLHVDLGRARNDPDGLIDDILDQLVKEGRQPVLVFDQVEEPCAGSSNWLMNSCPRYRSGCDRSSWRPTGRLAPIRVRLPTPAA